MTGWISGALKSFVDWLLGVVSMVLQWLADLVSLVLGLIVDLFGMFLTWAAGALITVPEGVRQGPIPGLLVQANYFLPLGTIFACLTVLGAFYAGSYLYKLAKFIRGGG